MSMVNADQMLRLRGFVVEIDGATGKEVDNAWERVDGGQCVVETKDCVETEHGHDAVPGKRYVSEIVLRGAMTDARAALCQWINDASTARAPDDPRARRTLRVTPLLHNGHPARTVEYHDCFPTRYVFPRLSVTNTTGNVQEEVRIKPIRCELK